MPYIFLAPGTGKMGFQRDADRQIKYQPTRRMLEWRQSGAIGHAV
jgi:hypothetical protein